MATIQRPTKEGSVRTYQEKVGLGFVDILASEMDADLDTIYAAWNGGVDNVTLKDGAVSTAKLVDGAVTTPKLGDLAVTNAKIANATIVASDKIAPNTITSSLLAPGGTIKNQATMTIPVNWTIPVKNAWTNFSYAPFTTTGGNVSVFWHTNMLYWMTQTTGASCYVRVLFDPTVIFQRYYTSIAPAGVIAPYPGFTATGRVAAGTYSVLVDVWCETNAAFLSPNQSASMGQALVVEWM